MAEYYIREADSDEAKGPFDPGRIADLMEAGKASETTLFYDEDREDWLPLMECEEVRQVLEPQAKPLHLKPRDAIENSLNDQDELLPEQKVNDMLAAAEGNTEETKHLRLKARHAETAATISLPALAVIMLLAAIIDIWPNLPIVTTIQNEGDWGLLLAHPLLIVGVIDLLLTLACVLSVTDAFPIIRFRMMLGLGYFGYIFWSWGEIPQMIAVILASLAAWVCTITLNLYAMIAAAAIGIVGMGTVAFFTVIG